MKWLLKSIEEHHLHIRKSVSFMLYLIIFYVMYSLIQEYEFILERNPILDDQFTDSRLKRHMRDKGLVYHICFFL